MLKLLSVLILFFASIDCSSNVELKCPEGSVPSRDRTDTFCLLFVKQPKTYPEAEKYCREQGGQLVRVRGIIKGLFLNDEGRKHLNGPSSFWIGQWILDSSNVSMSVWTRANGFTISAHVQNVIGFNNSSSLDVCAAITLAENMTVPCAERLPSVCEVETAVRHCAEGYHHFAKTDKCYKVFSSLTEKHTFEQAETVCVKDGGHLASIHSQKENVFVASLAPGAAVNDSMSLWIGTRSDQRRVPAWTDQSSAGYSNYKGVRNPPAATCATLLSDGDEDGLHQLTWDWKFCSNKFGRFVCKKNILSLSDVDDVPAVPTTTDPDREWYEDSA